MPIELEGMLEHVIFHNEENGYTVFNLTRGEDEITCVANIAEPREGESLKVEGEYVNNPRYGTQLSISKLERIKPNSLAGIEKYLASGVIKGMGAKTAQQIVECFGEDSFEIIENFPEKLAKIRGISLSKAQQFSENFQAKAEERQVVLFLQEYGITPSTALKIHKRYKSETIEVVKTNPYRLADEIDGMGFKTADSIAHKMGISKDAPQRISAGVRYCLWEATNEGHTYMPAKQITHQVSELLLTDTSLIENELVRMQMERHIVCERVDGEMGETDTLVFLGKLYYAESKIAQKILSLAATHAPKNDASNNDEKNTTNMFKEEKAAIMALERENNISLSEGQREAVLSAITQGVLIVTGGPGTGKTTTINTIIGLLESKDLEITLAAPTGRAAKRMTEATGREAKTIHRLLEVSFISVDSRKQVFNKNEDSPLETDVLIVDEASMMDVLLMHSLLLAIATGTRLILVGDVDQLPSVGAGNVLKDIIDSGTVPVARLTEIFRQAAESAIIMNAHKINKGEYPELNDKNNDFFFVRRHSPEDVIQAVLNLVSERLPNYKGFNSLHDIQVLSPMRKSPLGVANLNMLLQAQLNPPHPDKREREYGMVVFREGDKVMQIRNNYDAIWELFDERGRSIDFGEGVFNGDMGSILSIAEYGLVVQFDDGRQVAYEFSQLEELELAYAVTVHKSQGSEYRVVVIPVYSGPPMLLTRNLLYTAVTRAKELAVLVGEPTTLERMIDNNRVTRRYTALARRLRDLHEIIGKQQA